MSQSGIILVTGATGFIGAHTVKQLLEAGYHVRGTARGAKLDTLRAVFKEHGSKFEAVEISNIATDDFTEILKGVTAIYHMASPLPGKESAESALKSAVEGCLNIMRQALQAGIHKVILTSSWGAQNDPPFAQTFQGVTYTEKTWGKTSREDLLAHADDPVYVYLATKILAEEAAWKFAGEHPELDLTVLLPPFVYGRPVPGISTTDPKLEGSNAFLYGPLLDGPAGRPMPAQTPPMYTHIRDVARAQVLALKVPKVPAGADPQGKRIMIIAGPLLYEPAVRHLLKVRPELKERLPVLEGAPALPGPLSKIDGTRAKELLGITEWIGWEETVEETVDALLEAEKAWAAQKAQ